ncbi:MAG: protein-L-isoaspartate(D-aspartate) O-methyltransferase [Chloroflexi bacterium]|nr:protein-L-isoaspartate(D-aspartate) O-methyltransferase [Chloroflexota bacterium]
MDLEQARERLFAALSREVPDRRVIRAMRAIRRELFVPPDRIHVAYEDIPVPIGEGQTVSQPYIVALMTSSLHVYSRDKVLEVGTGSGYQAAILSLLARRVITVERVSSLADAARARLEWLRRHNVKVVPAGETLGCPEEAPFDCIIVAAGAPHLPGELVGQLAPGGRMVIPIGSRYEQNLTQVIRTQEGISVHTLWPCRFVPLIGKGAWPLEEVQ